MWLLTVAFVILIAVILAGIVPSAELPFGRLSRAVGRRVTPRVAVVGAFLVAMAVAGLTSGAGKWPIPRTHDEFAHLLAADTFRQGRLTNPPHEHWPAFETFHVIQQPTYMSKFAPAPDFFLALGWKLTGAPITGAWLLHGLACAAVAWMLLAFVGARWAALASVLLAIHPQMLDWSQSFWGGSTALLGGALLVGGLERSARGVAAAGWWAGLGGFLLAGSRPYEGFVLAVLVVMRWVVSIRRFDRPRVARAVMPLVAAGLVTLGFTAYYNARLTGSALTFPHRLYATLYAPSPLLVGGKPAPIPEYRHNEMRDYHMGPELEAYRLQRTTRGKALALLLKAKIVAEAAIELPLALGPKGPAEWVWWPVALLAFLPVHLKRGRDRWVWAFIGAFIVASFLVLWTQPHYAAPVVPLAVLGFVGLLRRARAFAFRWRGGRRLTVLVCGLMVVGALVQVAAMIQPYDGPWMAVGVRAKMIEHLKKEPGRDLVFVGYGPRHFLNFEWVYNEADIDGAEVVWARRLDNESNERLIDYFSERRIWLVDADAMPPRLIPLERPKEGKTGEERESRAAGELPD
jgi:hypothetical protein